MKTMRILLFFLLVFGNSIKILAQDEEEENLPVKKPKFLTGFYLGSYFPNKYTATVYNGYGFALDGTQNAFQSSLMYQKIKMEYGGGYGQRDQIADALSVDQKQWEFNETDMPINMRYTPAIMVGLNFKLPVMKRSAFIFNLNATKLSVEGNFTMTLIKPQNPNPTLNTNQRVCAIRGNEQRLQFQLGFQHVFGKNDKAGVFGELGLNGTLAKFDKNVIYINDLQIDLTYYANDALYIYSVPARKPVGFGLGAFAGLGINFEMNPKFSLQFLYTLSHEKVNLGNSPTLKLQHALGLRIYYKF